MTEAAVVTGLGVAAPNGLGTKAYWAATLAGTTGIAPITRFDPSSYPIHLAGEVDDFVPEDHIETRLLPQTDHMTRMALAAADWALADAGVDPACLPEYDMGVVTANASGGFEFGQRELQKLWSKGSRFVSAYQSFAWFYAVNTGQISIRHGMRGPCGVLVAEQAGGLDAVAEARRNIRRGTRVVVTGGMDAALCPWGLVAQITSGGLSSCDDPTQAYRPFDRGATGWVPGEGGAILILESATSARERGAPNVYGQVAGYAATFDPKPGSGRGPALRRAAELALAEAGMSAGEIDVVFADASGVPSLDRVEAQAIVALFGPHGVPVTAPKTMIGRLYSGGAPVDLAAALLSIRDGVIPPTINVHDISPGIGIDLVTDEPREQRVESALVLARGFGGFNSAMALRTVR
ncbi:MAG: minimal chain-length factor beta [Actinomycetota bacterium]|jgi:act minimal PKS chain-length factor (CLF/KS beta)|nr:minimal chain-length factor beta [Actinomycetota bacterium]